MDARGPTDPDDEVHRRRRSELAARLAHEVRSPVAAIKGLAATVLAHDDRLSTEERRELVGLIGTEARRLLEVVDQVALALRIEADDLVVRPRATPLAPVVHEAVATAAITDHPVTIEVPAELQVRADRRWLLEALAQGMRNAARYSPAGEPILVRGYAADGAAVAEICDRGPGVPPERREEVFERLTTWRPPGYEDRPGAGLGLYICRAIAIAHGGRASLHGGREGGTILRLQLPTGADGGRRERS